MTARTPITFADIRVGDTAERESGGVVSRITVASRGGLAVRSGEGGVLFSLSSDGSTWFLLDRPTPPVALPTEPTLGWLSTDSMHRRLGIYETPPEIPDAITDNAAAGYWEASDVTTFIPATAVPASALDTLRHMHAGGDEYGASKCGWVADFLAAVDNAGGAL